MTFIDPGFFFDVFTFTRLCGYIEKQFLLFYYTIFELQNIPTIQSHFTNINIY